MANARTFDIAVIAFTFVGGYALYRAIVNAGWAFAQFAVYPEFSVSDLLALFTAPVVLAVFGGALVFARHRLAHRLFGSLEARAAETASVPLYHLITVLGVYFLASGVICGAGVAADWLARNVDPLPEYHPRELWPERVVPITELVIGYLLAFRARAIEAWLVRQQGTNHHES